MYILGDIGNSETKVFLVNKKDKILKNFYFPTNKININILNRKLSSITNNFKKIEKVLFCSVVPKTFSLIRRFFSQKKKN